MKIITNEKYIDKLIETYHIDTFFSDFKKLRPSVRLIEFPKNTYIYSNEEHRKYLFFHISGTIILYLNDIKGNSMFIRRHDQFSFIGDMELMGYKDTSNLTRTETDCTFIGIDTTSTREVLLKDHVFLLYLCKNLAEKLDYLCTTQSLKQLSSAQQYIAQYILMASEKKGYFKENLRKVSDAVGVSYRHLHRILGALVKKGILAHSDRGYEVIDKKALELLVSIED